MKYIPAMLVMAFLLTACMGGGGGSPEGVPFKLERNTEFDGESLRLFVRFRDGTEESVNTTDDVIGVQPGVTPVPGHQARALTFLKITDDATSVAHALVSWDPDDPANYLVAGWWARFPDQEPPLSFEDFMPFGIVDGPELDHGVAPQLPIDGTASYAGPAGGLYAYEFGSDWGENEGEVVIEEYQGTATLTADFEDGTLKGCIGCVGDLATQRAHFGVFSRRGGERCAGHCQGLRTPPRHGDYQRRRHVRARQGDVETPGADNHAIGGVLERGPFQPPGHGREPPVGDGLQRRRLRGERWQQRQVRRVFPGSE